CIWSLFSNNETLIHILKGSLGTGILAMPKAFKDSGMVNGFVFTLLIGFLCTYCLHMLVQAQYVLCKRLKIPMLTYPESMKVALNSGPIWMRRFANMSP
ncbi:proton-coupled amino acid transporter-like protein CG1139, partial [Agrilus planipennis]|uniref:Proton-coupled amino acid transporter-like protein CG1139 n=1 Tax=Agrilus planipennis TaxID=224129 RepID=A0A1W4XG55_AGRPL